MSYRYIYIKVIKMIHFKIATSPEPYMLLTSYFQHFILHHFSLVKLILGSCISFVPVLQCPIPLGVQTGHIFRQDISINFKFGLYAEGSCTYRFVLFVNFYLIRYGDTAVQSNCTFLVHFAPLTYYNLVPATPST